MKIASKSLEIIQEAFFIMAMMTLNDVILTMTICVFVVGLVSVGAGIFILITRVLSEDLRTITRQTVQIGEKGIAEEVSGLVGNAATLISSLNNLIKTTAGIGLSVLLIGLVLIISSYLLIYKIQ
jgi:hypothetical protein